MSTGGFVSDIITWVRRIIKAPSTQSISDQTILDYLNRFISYDVPGRVQLFDLRRQYTFETQANVFEYQFPINTYSLVRPPVYVDGIIMDFTQSTAIFYGLFPELVQNAQPLLGDGTPGPYTTTFAGLPIIPGFVDDLGNREPYVFITMVDSGGVQHYIVDSGYYNSIGEGILIETDATFQIVEGDELTPTSGPPYTGGGNGVINYTTGVATWSFDEDVPSGSPINTQTSSFAPGLPRMCLFYNNTFKLFPIPDRPYKVQMDCYVSPAQFLTTADAVPFAWMSEYFARGTARKILADTGDVDQFNFYEPLFKEQENLVLRRTTRQNGTQRTPTIFSQSSGSDTWGYSRY